MENLRIKLRDLVVDVMIPESEVFLEELHKEVENKTANEDDMEAIKDMESFLVELQNIVTAIDEDNMSDEEVQVVYEKISTMLEEHEEGEN